MLTPIRRSLGITAIALAICPLALSAQSPATADSAPFRAGQWGAEFGLGNFASAGVLRFRSPTTAWFGSVTGQVERNSATSDLLRPREQTLVDLSLGHRWYRPATPNIWQYATVGALVGYSTTEVTTRFVVVGQPVNVLSQATSERLAGGAFLELGAQWLVTSHLALGAGWQAQATVGRQTESDLRPGTEAVEQATTAVGLSLGRVAIRGTLYF
jgi:hypothetical protein